MKLWKVDIAYDDEDKLKHLRNFFSDQPLVVVDENIYVIVQVPAAADSIYKWIQQFTLRRDRNRLVTYFGKDFEFYGRDDAIDILWNGDKKLGRNGIVERFKHHNERDKENHPIPVVACGTGKSRFLDEIEELLTRNAINCDNEDIRNTFSKMAVINTTYGNGSLANKIDQYIDAEYFRLQRDYDEFSFASFRSLCKKYSTLTDLTLDIALRIVHTDTIKQKNQEINSNPLLVLVLGIDELNKLHDINGRICGDLVNFIGGTMLDLRGIFFIPIIGDVGGHVEIKCIIQRVESKLSNEYGLGLYSREVLAKAILDLPVSKEEKINFDDKLTSYQDLSSMGFINLMQLQKNFIFGSLICGQVYLFPAGEVFFLNTSKFVDYDIAIGKDNVSDTKDTKDNADDTKDDEMDIDDDEMETNDGEMDIDDDKMDTDDKMDYKTFDSYTKLDQSVADDNIIYINASGASYDAFQFLKYCEQHSNEANDRLCVCSANEKTICH
ncbi:hypothetical protein RhiirC2_770967 [Rhizophagus irregularis]|uniref:Crinkler family protein n=1 Tax=Rhizophagus irregularis TaxID=588596 RepID=A0A2N1NV43_9GLOM|nr:hypothetical protein RhiirC2_770967 [Rhizophagus irregularis]